MIRSGSLVVSVGGVEVIKSVEGGSVTVVVDDSPILAMRLISGSDFLSTGELPFWGSTINSAPLGAR